MIVYVAIAAMFAMMGGIVLYASLDNPELELVKVELVDVRVVSEDTVSKELKIESTFLVSNPSKKTFTVPVIAYDIFGDGTRVASGQYSTEDIAMPGRAAFYPGAEIPLKSFTTISREDNPEIYDKMTNERFSVYSAEGIITAESAWSLVEKEFQTGM